MNIISFLRIESISLASQWEVKPPSTIQIAPEAKDAGGQSFSQLVVDQVDNVSRLHLTIAGSLIAEDTRLGKGHENNSFH